jgi:WD40 repeat protein
VPLYFVCYSRAERDLVAKVEAKLAARRRRGELDVWRDVRNLDVWDLFTPEIASVLATANGAIVVVSDAWYGSDYIHTHEWPTIQARRERDPSFGIFLLAVNDLDGQDPLRERNFVNDLREELLVAATDATRDRVLTRLSDLVGAHARTVRSPSAAPQQPVADFSAVQVRAPDPGRPSWRLHLDAGLEAPGPTQTSGPDTVPPEPGLFVEPAELDVLRERLTGGGPRVVGLFGEGGTGKSVLATVAAHQVAADFAAGVHWVTVGEQAGSEDVRRLQAVLLQGLSAYDGSTPRDVNHGKELLGAALAASPALVVVDDVWHPWQARAFDVVGPGGRSRMLFTTRFPEALPVGSATVEVGRLPRPEATAFLAGLPFGLPAAAADTDAVLDAAGGLRLALAVLAATASVEGSWAAVVGRLAGLSARFGSGDDASSAQKALFVAIDTLDDDDRHRALMLGAFPSDVVLPVSVLADLWDLPRSAADAVAARLIAKDIAVSAAGGFTLHDHVHDFLVLQAPAPASEVHLSLWELALRRADGGWAAVAERDPYLWDRLVWHACRAGLNRATLWRLVGDLDWLAERIRRQGAAAAEADVIMVARMTAVADDAPLSLLHRVLCHGALFEAADDGPDLRVSLQAWADAIGLARPGPRRLRWGSLPVPSPELWRTVRGHTADVWSLDASADGRLLATGSSDGTARVWDAGTGEQLLVLTVGNAVWDVAFGPDGRHLATGCDDGAVRVWALDSGACLSTLRAHRGAVWGVAWPPDGRRLLTGSEDGTAVLWDLASEQPVRVLQESAGPVWAVAAGPDAAAATGGQDHVVRLWDVGTGTAAAALEGHTGPVRDLAYSPDGDRLASTGDDGTVRLWDVPQRRLAATLRVHRPGLTGRADQVSFMTYGGVAFGPGGRRLATAGSDGTARIWDAETGDECAVLTGHGNAVVDVAFAPDGRRLATSGADTTLRIWDLAAAGTPDRPPAATGRVHGIAVSHDGRSFATARSDSTVTLCDAVTGERVRELTGAGAAAWGIAFAPDDRRLAATTEDGTVLVWDVATGSTVQLLTGHDRQVWDLAWSPDGRRLASAGEDGTVRLWDPSDGRQADVLRGHLAQVRDVAFDPAGRWLASTGDDGVVRLWDPASGESLRELAGHEREVWDVAFTAGGRMLASAGDDGTIRLWDVPDGTPRRTLVGHTGPVSHLAVAPDGRHLASNGGDGAARVWDLETGRCVLTLALACTGPVAWRQDVLLVGAAADVAAVALPDLATL